ncbi:MAG: hypothetical protein HZA54_05200 [Planctomycetes bacterium]|nr:hypothetical protein [Planctomycetota bacterium]
MSRKRWLLFAATLAVGVLAFVAHRVLSVVPRALHPAITSSTRVDDLVRLLVADRLGAEQDALLAAFADAARPAEGTRALASSNGRVIVLVAANGTARHPDGFDAVWDREGEDIDLAVLLAGRGRSVGLLGAGGRGGCARAAGSVIGTGGAGGAGFLRGGHGGPGGLALCTNKVLVPARANGGAGGSALIAAGDGARGGMMRVTAPSAPGLLGQCGDGGRGLIGGNGGGDHGGPR